MKKIFKNLIFSLCAIALSVGLVFVNAPKAIGVTHAEQTLLKTENIAQANTIVVSDITGGLAVYSKTLNLYTSSADLANFSYRLSDDAGLENDDDRLFHKNQGPTKINPANAQFLSTIDFSKNIQFAISQGVVNISASADVCSPDCGKYLGFSDNKDTVYFETYLFNDSAEIKKSADEVKSFESVNRTNTYSSEEIKGTMYSKFTLSARNNLGGAGVYNSLEMKNPTVIVSTTDTTAPVITFPSDIGYATSRVLAVGLSDSESGVYKLEVSKNDGDYTEIANYAGEDATAVTTNTTCNYSITENGTYKFRVTDNVGNVSEQTYIEEKIDTVAPSISIVDFPEDRATLEFDFEISLESNNMSVDSYYYTITYNGVTSEEISILSAVNHLVTKGIGQHIVTFYARDAVGNEMTPFSKSFYADPRTVVSLAIENSYSYRLNGLTLSVVPSVTGDYDITYSYFASDGISSIEKPSDAGSYIVKYSIDNDDFRGEGQQSFEIVPKEIRVSQITKTFVYDGKVKSLGLVFDDQTFDTNLVSTAITLDGKSASLLNVGTYNYALHLNSDNYAFVGDNLSGEVVISKKTVDVEVLTKTNPIFDGTAKQIEYKLSDEVDVVISYNGSAILPINAGRYNVNFELASDFATNYNLEFSIEFVIEKRAITISAVPEEITYGDAIPASFEYILSNMKGLTNSESEKFIFSLGVINCAGNVGEYDIVFDSLSSDAQENTFANYVLSFVPAKLEIKPRAISIIPAKKQSRGYNGLGVAGDQTLTYTVGDLGLANGDKLSGSLSREEGKNVGSYAITLGTITSENNPNYEITLVAGEKFEITKRNAYITINSLSKVYGQEVQTSDFSFIENSSGIIPDDLSQIDMSTLLLCDDLVSVGNHKIKLNTSYVSSNETLKNYHILSFDGVLTIKKAKIAVFAQDVEVEFGSFVELEPIVVNSEVQIELARESGSNVGEYAIYATNLIFDSYEIDFTPATYKIIPLKIKIIANDASKTYKTADVLSCDIESVADGTACVLDVQLVREAGEDVGSYKINGYVFEDANYEVAEFVQAQLTINPASAVVNILNASKTYGELDDGIYAYSVSGLIGTDVLPEIEFARAKGENVGKYAIYPVASSGADYGVQKTQSGYELNFKNYTASVVLGEFSITKADITLTLKDKKAIYSGEAVTIDALSMMDSSIVFEYYYDEKIDNFPVDAGTYKVYAKFAGNENYNSFISNTAVLVIEKKFVPVIFKKLTFLYTGSTISPEYEIGLDIPNATIFEYKNSANESVNPVEVGEYQFVVSFNNTNYTCSYYDEDGNEVLCTGMLKIVDEFYAEDSNGGASVSTSSVSFSGSDLNIQRNDQSKYMNRYNAVFDGRKCLAVYEFVGNKTAGSDAIFTVKIKANKQKGTVNIYALDENGNISELSYTLKDGYYELALNNTDASILITETNEILKYAKLIALMLVLILSFSVTKAINRRRKNNFFARNTTFKNVSKEDFESYSDIVESRVNKEQNISASEYLKN